MSISEVIVQKELYSISSIKKAFYIYNSKYSSSIKVVDDLTVRIDFDFPDDIDEKTKSNILTSFQHELVDQSLRENIAAETELTRNLILANAFSNAPIGEGE